ncbi:hypothetical protein UlMin_018182 [Ulmus minor]
MHDSKLVSLPIAAHFKLDDKLSQCTEEENEQMNNIPYSSAIGSLMYSMVSTRPDICFAMSVLSRFMSNPGKQHWEAVKWLFRYIKGTTNVGLIYEKKEEGTRLRLEGFVDVDYAGNLDNRKSTTTYMFCLND